jgi:hypothetical protein
MMWSEISKPVEGVSFYDHTYLNTPLGKVIIEWKSWKESPDYGVALETEDAYIGTAFDLESAKDMASKYILDKYSKFMASQKRKPVFNALPLSAEELKEVSVLEGKNIETVYLREGSLKYSYSKPGFSYVDYSCFQKIVAIKYILDLFDLENKNEK